MSEKTIGIILGVLAIELINCKDRESGYFKDIAKAIEEFKAM